MASFSASAPNVWMRSSKSRRRSRWAPTSCMLSSPIGRSGEDVVHDQQLLPDRLRLVLLRQCAQPSLRIIDMLLELTNLISCLIDMLLDYRSHLVVKSLFVCLLFSLGDFLINRSSHAFYGSWCAEKINIFLKKTSSRTGGRRNSSSLSKAWAFIFLWSK